MHVIKRIVVATVVLAAALVGAGQLGWLRGAAPNDLGVREGRLRPPSLTANSVSSQAGLHPDHPQQMAAAIAPLPVTGDGMSTVARISDIVEARKGTKVVVREPGYLQVEFETPLLGFVDDAEFWFNPTANVIDVRSAARVGRFDFGVNRERIEVLRLALLAKP